MSKKLDNQIQRTLARLKKLKSRKAEAQRVRKAAAKAHPETRRRGGRPKIDEITIKKAKLDALNGKPLADVALKYSIGLTTLYRYGIKRKELEKEIDNAE